MCVKPVKMTEGVYLACGNCFECKMHRVNDWATRLMAEAYTTPPYTFCTLTYNELSIPRKSNGDYTFDRQHLKQITRELSRRHPCRYYGIAEHGTENERPHYHLIVFGVPPMVVYEVLEQYWSPRGFYTMGEPINARIMYIALFHVLKSHSYPDEFTVMSRRPGIGAYFFENIIKDGRKLKKQLKDSQIISELFKAKDGRIQLGGEIRLLPRYMLDQLDDSLKADIKDARRKHVFKRLSEFTGITINDLQTYTDVLYYMSKEKKAEWKKNMDDVNRYKTERFKKNHKKSRHIETIE